MDQKSHFSPLKPKQIRSKTTTPAPIKTTTTTTPIVQISSPQKRSKSVNWDSNFSFDEISEKTDTKPSKESIPKTPKPILKKNQRRKSRSPYDVDYDEMWTFSDEIHAVLGNRPKMFPGFIGGHCVIPNLDLIQNQTLNLIKSINEKYSKQVKNSKSIHKKYTKKN